MVVDLTQQALDICKAHYHHCDCPIRSACVGWPPTHTKEQLNKYIEQVNKLAEEVSRNAGDKIPGMGYK